MRARGMHEMDDRRAIAPFARLEETKFEAGKSSREQGGRGMDFSRVAPNFVLKN